MLLRRNPDFCLMWLGQFLSQASLRTFQIAVMWWIIAIHSQGSGMKAGLFMVSGALPAILFANIIGKTIEKTGSRRILLTCALLAAVFAGTVSVLLHFSTISITGTFIAGFLIAFMEAFLDPTLNKAVVEVVKTKDIEDAVAFQSSTQSLANFGGAMAGAMLIDKLGVANVVLTSAAGYLLAGVFYSTVGFRRALKPAHAASGEMTISGWKILGGMPFLKKILIGFGFVNFFATPILVILPLYTKHTLNAGASVMGILEASLWIGLLLGTFSSRWFNFRSTIKLGAACMATMGICLLVPGLIIDQLLYTLMLLTAGFALGVNNVKFITLFQNTVPSRKKGRFFALMQAVITASFPISYFVFGMLADYMTPPKICLIQGFGIILVAGFFLSLVKEEEQAFKDMPAPAAGGENVPE